MVALLRPVARHVAGTAAVAKPAAVTAKLPRAFRRARQAIGIPCSDGLEEGLETKPAVLVAQQSKRRGWRVVGVVCSHVDTAARQPQTAKMKNVGAVGVRAVESGPNGQSAEIAERWSCGWSHGCELHRRDKRRARRRVDGCDGGQGEGRRGVSRLPGSGKHFRLLVPHAHRGGDETTLRGKEGRGRDSRGFGVVRLVWRRWEKRLSLEGVELFEKERAAVVEAKRQTRVARRTEQVTEKGGVLVSVAAEEKAVGGEADAAVKEGRVPAAEQKQALVTPKGCGRRTKKTAWMHLAPTHVTLQQGVRGRVRRVARQMADLARVGGKSGRVNEMPQYCQNALPKPVLAPAPLEGSQIRHRLSLHRPRPT